MILSKSLRAFGEALALPVRPCVAREIGVSLRGAARALPLAAAFLLALSAGANAQIVTTVPTVAIDSPSAVEGQGVEFTVTVTPPQSQTALSAALRLSYTTAPGTAQSPADFTAATNMELLFGAGATGPSLTQTFEIATASDTLAEGDETFTVALSGPPGEELQADLPGPATGTITDDPADLLTISVRDPDPVDEGGTAVFSVSIDGAADLPADLMLGYTIEAGSATSDDYTDLTGGTVTLAADAATRTAQDIRVMAVSDGLGEQQETFMVVLSSTGLPGGVQLNRGTAMGTINASEADTADVEVSIADGSAVEGEPVTFTVTLSDTPGAEVQLQYSTSSGTADSPADFTPATNMALMTFAADATGADLSQTFEIATEDDEETEGDETFTVTLSAPAGTMLPANVTLNPATATGTIRDPETPQPDAGARLGRINAAMLPHAAQAMMSNTLAAIGGRLDAAAPGGTAGKSAAGLAGKPNLLQALKASEQGLRDGTTDLEQALGESSFMLPLNAAGDRTRPATGNIVLWGSGDRRQISGPDGGALDWDGDMSSFHLGADVRARPDLLAGAAISHASGSFDYANRAAPAAEKGNYDSRMVSVHPYLSWSPSGDANVWAAGSYGKGDIEIDEAGGASHRSDTSMWMAAAGASRRLLSDDGLIEGGTASLRLKGDGGLARIEAEGGGMIRPVEFDVQRLRVALEGRYECASDAGGCLSPSAEVAVRHDGGDARTGIGVELGGGLRWTDRASGLTIGGRGQVLVLDDDDHEDWSVGGQIVIDPGSDGMGVSFRLEPGFGDAARDADRLYERGAAGITDVGAAPAGRLETEIGYGFAGVPGSVVTPYTGLSLADGSARRYRAGVRIDAGPALGFSLEGTRREYADTAADHGVMARGRLHW